MAIHITPDLETSLLIHSDEVEGTQLFKDSSTYGHTVSYTGAVHHDTGSPSKFGRSSMYFDGGGENLTIADHSSFDFGYGDFTIDFWLRLNSAGGNKNYISRRRSSGTDTLWYFRTEHGPEYQFNWNDGSNNYNMLGGVPETNVWHHLAIVRRGRLVKMYEDGIVIDTHTETSPRTYDAGLEVLVGARYSSGVIQILDGWIDELRITKGIARWNDSFVPPNKPYSVIGGDAVTDISGIDDDGLGNTSFSDIVIRSDPSEASTDSVFSVNAKDGTELMNVSANGVLESGLLKVDAEGAVQVYNPHAGIYMTSFSDEFDAAEVKNIQMKTNVNVFGSMFINVTGNYGNANAIGAYEVCFSVGVNSVNTGIFSPGSDTIVNIGGTSAHLSFGTPVKPDAVTYNIPVTNLHGTYAIDFYFNVVFKGYTSGIISIKLV